jgi:hypothetical protein
LRTKTNPKFKKIHAIDVGTAYGIVPRMKSIVGQIEREEQGRFTDVIVIARRHDGTIRSWHTGVNGTDVAISMAARVLKDYS